MNHILPTLQAIDHFIWGAPLLILLVGTGIYFTFRLNIIQIRHLPTALKLVFGKSDDHDLQGDVSSFSALCTALSATIGTGNIVGVATAIQLGGPGALFWMWIAALFGMSTKYAECLLAVKYRRKDSNGQMLGGPMYYLEDGLKSKPLAILFSVFALAVACFGIGTFPQVNAIVSAGTLSFGVPTPIIATTLTLIVALVTIGGIKSIAKVAEKVVPTMAVFYVVMCLLIIFMQADQLLAAFQLVLSSAFNLQAIGGGAFGGAMMLAIQAGVSRGVFSNESGLGSAPIAAAAAQTSSPAKQGLISMTGTFLDTIIICTMTGLALILTGAWQSGFSGAAMTSEAFSVGLSATYGPILLATGLAFFAFTTILGWHYYGERCVVYLFGTKAVKWYKGIFITLIASGSFLHLDVVWVIADIVNGLMAIPNLIGLLALRHVVRRETQAYFGQKERAEIHGI
ncbi:sodium:alanine symporter family protein [Vibrio profundum]|uniref:alanine/glycine:cation symporter family protein n=1 Tax=Vibrio profundum TaxID=2910247 RepID=UPI003D0C1BE0